MIFLLHPEDESCEDKTYIHIVSLKEACAYTDDVSARDKSLDCIEEQKINDWTGLCSNKDYIKQINFALDKTNVLYVSTKSTLHAVSLNDLVPMTPSNLSINGAVGS